MPWVYYPVTKRGFLDRKAIFKLAYGTLKLQIGTLDEITPLEMMWLLESHYEQQEEELELLNHTIKTAMASINSRKNLKLFDKKEKQTQETKTIKKFDSKEDKLKALEELKELF